MTTISIPTFKNKILSINDLYKKITVEMAPQDEALRYYERQYFVALGLFRLYEVCEALQIEKGYEAELSAIEEVYQTFTQWEDKTPHDLKGLNHILLEVFSKLRSACEQELTSLRRAQVAFVRSFRSQVELGKGEKPFSEKRTQINLLNWIRGQIQDLVDEVEDEGVDDNPLLPPAIDNLFSLYVTIGKMQENQEDIPSMEVLEKFVSEIEKIHLANPTLEHEEELFKMLSELKIPVKE